MALLKIHHGYAGNMTETEVNSFGFIEINDRKFAVSVLEKLADPSNVGRTFEVAGNVDGAVFLKAHTCGGDGQKVYKDVPPVKPAPVPAPAAVTPVEPKPAPKAKADAPKEQASLPA